jgi:diaminopropionate ammonia-lyase
MPSIFYADDRARAVAAAAPFGAAAATTVLAAIGACPEHAATPLRRLPEPARAWGLREVWVKDERARLGLRSFKALGGAYAVLCLSAELKSRERGAVTSIGEMLRGPRPILPDVTFTAATAGNHGCSVAAGARLVGARCCIFVAAGAPAEQVRAIAAQGAQIVSVPGRYEDSLEACRVAAESNGWIAVADCATDANDSTVQRVMEGYTVIAAEILAARTTPSHAFLQAGVGGMAAAIAAHFVAMLGDRAPTVVVVEPELAACLQASARADRAMTITQTGNTNMGRLACYAPSACAWPVLRSVTTAYATVDDAEALAACEVLEQFDLATTPSGAAGFAALSRVAASREDRQRLRLGADSEVLVIVTEAALTAE